MPKAPLKRHTSKSTKPDLVTQIVIGAIVVMGAIVAGSLAVALMYP